MEAKRIGLTVLLSLVAGAALAASMEDPASREVLAAMGRTSTWGHPDEFGEFAGMRYYADGNYAKAMEYFRLGARYADKLSQLSIGLMYLHGEGVERDPATAYAWLSLAAERGYPRYVATRDELWKTLDAAQRAQATATLAQLSVVYGDAVAKPRMAKELRQAKGEMTGSYLGFGASSVETLTRAQFAAANPGLGFAFGADPMPACGAKSIDGAPITGCGYLYVAWRWDAKEYFRIRDAVWTGTVKVGDAEKAGVPD
ncbi:tetratricopeptide repeat protein [Dyella japonica]|uniref:tetratricopeptide repeat protein n=1 Tax=Dyella japonica TaxID=231455 RepID=UPI000377F4EF|nr:SEL1-like repeat protein [Dyella japonica]